MGGPNQEIGVARHLLILEDDEGGLIGTSRGGSHSKREMSIERLGFNPPARPRSGSVKPAKPPGRENEFRPRLDLRKQPNSAATNKRDESISYGAAGR